jgi:tripartite-type tricarboxylate transporter receptor subunit TctC
MPIRLLVASLLLMLATNTPARAQDAYPSKPVRMIVAWAVGGATDIAARLVAPKMTESLGQQVIVENKPGAGAVIGTDFVAKAAPDGYTVLLGEISSMAINPTLYKRIPYDSVKDLVPIGQVLASSFILAVHVSVPATDLKSFVALMRANPGKYNYGSPGIGSMPHLCTEMLKAAVGGLDITHVPYRGAGPVMIDLAAGQISMSMPTPGTLLPQMAAGTVRPIGAGPKNRERALPDLPTIEEQGVPGYECYNWFGLFAPLRTPQPILDKLRQAMQVAINDKTVQTRLLELGLEPTPNRTPEALGELVRVERDKWAPIIRSLGAQLE